MLKKFDKSVLSFFLFCSFIFSIAIVYSGVFDDNDVEIEVNYDQTEILGHDPDADYCTDYHYDNEEGCFIPDK